MNQLKTTNLRRKRRLGESLIQGLLFASGFVSIFTTLGIIYELGKEALLFFQMPEFDFWASLTNTTWQPQAGEFGIWPLLTATFLTSAIAMSIAIPLGLAVAIYLSEYATPKVRSTLKPVLEVLAGIPTIVYGYFALMFMTPLLRSIFGTEIVQVYNTASAGLVMGILILPLITSMSEDALNAVPRSLREAAYGLGATKLEVAVQVVLPAALSGIAAAVILGISRAVGETMIVALAAGAGPNFTFNPFVGAETVTGHIVRISGGDLSYDSVDYNSIFALGLLLFFITLSLNVISQRIVRRFREVYE
jgi:phosphate transport system permease protein